ncbi:hypothetical protein K458DRAFT_393720 [Lentithecium fluviatile CBS 122367]|uniref:CRIB domain-containing protein n=1 Tax=Lentithecium fluviatile CBS 122367 TaxID=1168545 RepID=A0A6G1IMZ6_9PLEO|nr:hypothetical protein K458DRAFT_393720 [Lentithecium fluviatile CBS 122367]
MFTHNKTNTLPASRQSSVDSLVTVPSSSTSASDLWVSQCSTASSYGDLPSPERHTGTAPGKRSSVFNLRSRSNTATSTTSSFVSIAPPSMAAHDGSSRRSSQDLRHFTGHSFMELNAGRRSLFRGKKGKRLSGSLSPSFSSPDIDEADAGTKRTSVLRKNRRPNNLSERSTSDLKHRISSPFDFQHLTHTDRHQFASLQEASENELVVEFSAVRASQAPRRDLTGIKAQDLHFKNFSSEGLAADSRSTSTLGYRSAPISPNLHEQQQQPGTSPEESSGKALRLSRSVESFSRPGVTPRSHRHTQSANPPPRVSSRLPLEPIHDTPENTEAKLARPFSPNTRNNRQSGVWDKLGPLNLDSAGGQLPTMVEESDYVGHAFTTPDNSACPMTPPFSPALEDVAEEPERFVDPRPAPLPPFKSPKSPKSPTFDSFSFSNPRSPIAKSRDRKNSYQSPKSASQRHSMTRPMSQMSDTLASPGVVRRGSIRRVPTIRRKSNTWRAIEESWEDDIDYIYDNALEADCDFDWDRASVDGAFEDRDRTPEQQDHKRISIAASHDTQTSSLVSDEEAGPYTNFYPGSVRPSLFVPSVSSVPELESRSAISMSTADGSVQTPSDLYIPSRQYPFIEGDGPAPSPSFFVPKDFKEQVSREDMYADLLADYEETEGQFPFLEPSQSVSSSTRSSHVRSSKRSSYDSSLMSSGQGSGSWTSGTRRSASSAGSHGSLPDLVHSSRHARRDFTTMVDRLSEQVASFASFGEDIEENEDDETTPPGHASQERTFFASDDEQPETKEKRTSIENEVRSSLELARRGSARSTRAPFQYHKHASSDSAAKMLASASLERQASIKSRSRAASSSNAQRKNREQYLSLFPTPPTHSPLASPASPADQATSRM